MPKWSRVWKSTVGTCTQSCINFVDANTTNKTGVLSQFPPDVSTMAHAMRITANGMADRLSGKGVVVKSTSDSYFTITMRLARDVSSLLTVTLKFGVQLTYPVQSTYTYGADSGSASFGDVNEVIQWLAERVR